jgi:VCBS repeat-containing protein
MTGATFKDAAGNNLIISSSGYNPAGTLAVASTDNQNPQPVVDTASSTVAGDAAAVIAQGNVITNDIDPDLGDVLTVVAASVGNVATASTTAFTTSTALVGTFGTLVLGANGAYSYTPFANAAFGVNDPALTDVFTYKISDGHGGVASSQLSVVVHGANNSPVITSLDAAETKSLTESNATLSTSGAVTFTDADLVHVDLASKLSATVTAVAAAAGTPAYGFVLPQAQQTAIANAFSLNPDGTWSFSLASPDYLPQGQVVNAVFVVKVTDDQGAIATQNVSITITGSNDAPTLTTFAAYPPYVYENGSSQTYTADQKATSAGTTFADIDNLQQVHHVTTDAQGNVLWEKSGATTYTRTGSFGVATLNTATGTISYLLDDTMAETQALKASQTATDTFIISVTDGIAVTTKTVGFDVKGADDISTWNSATASAVQVYHVSADRAVVRIDLGATDVDSNQTYTATLTEGAKSTTFNLASSGGSLVGLVDLSGFTSASDYLLSVTASGGNTLTKTISGNVVGDATLITPYHDLATGGNTTNDLLLGSSFGAYLDANLHPESHPTFLGNGAKDVFDGLGGGMAFAGGAGNDTAIMQDSTLQVADNTGTGHHYAIAMLPTAYASTLVNDFNASSTFASAIALDGFATNQSAFVGLSTSTGMAYTDAENLVFANSASASGSGSTSMANAFLLGRDASNANALQLQLSDVGVRLVAGGHADNILGGAGSDVIVGNGNGNGALINGIAEAADIIHGGAGNDILAGGSYQGLQGKSTDVSNLYGDQGDDVLVAVSGTVNATGGTGRDVFALFDNTDSVNLIIKDFNATTDRIDLSALVDLKATVLSDPANSMDSSAALKSIMASAVTNSDGDLVLNFDAYLSADAKAADHHANITVHQASANDGQLSTQNFVFSELAWSPSNWHDNLNPLI